MALGCVVSVHTTLSVTTLELLNDETEQRQGVHCGWSQAPCLCSGVVLGTDRSWKVLVRQSGASRVNLGQCTMGLTSKDSLGASFVREITSIATYSIGIAPELQKFQCDGTHGHVPLTVKESNSAKSTQRRCVRPHVSQRPRRDMQQSRRRISLA